MEKRSSPPKKLKIKGQPHKLAYINDVEEGLLRARGGSGEMVHGIPAFYDEGDDYTGQGGNDSTNDFGLSDDFGGNDGNANDYISSQIQQANKVVEAQQALEDSLRRERAQRAAAGQAMVNNARNPYASSGLTAQDRAFNVTPNAQRIAQSYMNSLGANGKNIFAPSIFSNQRVGGSIGNFLKGGGLNSLRGTSLYSNYFDDPSINKAIGQAAIDQIQGSGRIENAKNNYGIPSLVGGIAGAVGGYNLQNIQDKIAAGGRPVLDENGVVQGVFHDGLFGMEVYSGNPVAGIEGTGYQADDFSGSPDPIENPLTGEKECPEGYFFDEDLQACRMGSAAASDETVAPVTAPATGAYYRPTGLETASAFTPAGFDYDAANSAFLDSYAYRPENYQDPMSLNGFKQIT